MAATPFKILPVGATPESVVPGFGGRLYVTLMGVKRAQGDGDGKVTAAVDHAPGMPDPNGVDALPDGTILVAELFRGALLAWKTGVFRSATRLPED